MKDMNLTQEEIEVTGGIEEENMYLRNLKLILNTVQFYRHIFTEDELKLVSNFLDLPQFSQSLCAWMFFWKRIWFSLKQLIQY